MDTQISWKTDMGNARDSARAKRKPILLFFHNPN